MTSVSSDVKHTISGIHHVTAIASDPQRNLAFYTRVLGLRLVKRTVNFDDPNTYHLYYGDEVGQPGTILTIFPWSGAPRGRRGTGQVAVTSFSIPQGSLGYWQERLKRHGVSVGELRQRFDEEVLKFEDGDGLALELIAHAGAAALPPWEAGPVPTSCAVRGIHSVALWERDLERTAALLEDIFGFRLIGEEAERLRFESAGEGTGSRVDLIHRPNGEPGWNGPGTVHHVAWRTPDDEQQAIWRRALGDWGLQVTSVRDRQYFRSIYFREPGGVLFEIATDVPGFAVDEAPGELGSRLKLPPWLERQRIQIEQTLPKLELSGNGSRG